MSELVAVHPAALRDWWPTILPGLEACRKRGVTWIPEDVYHALRAGLSSLHVGLIDGEYAGFLVLTAQQDYDGAQLFVWCCYAKTEADPIALYIDDLKELARAAGTKRIVFGSTRKWERRLAEYGAKPLTAFYEIPL